MNKCFDDKTIYSEIYHPADEREKNRDGGLIDAITLLIGAVFRLFGRRGVRRAIRISVAVGAAVAFYFFAAAVKARVLGFADTAVFGGAIVAACVAVFGVKCTK